MAASPLKIHQEEASIVPCEKSRGVSLPRTRTGARLHWPRWASVIPTRCNPNNASPKTKRCLQKKLNKYRSPGIQQQNETNRNNPKSLPRMTHKVFSWSILVVKKQKKDQVMLVVEEETAPPAFDPQSVLSLHQALQTHEPTKGTQGSSHELEDFFAPPCRKIQFAPFTSVIEIPNHIDYSEDQKASMWANFHEIRENKKYINKEIKWEREHNRGQVLEEIDYVQYRGSMIHETHLPPIKSDNATDVNHGRFV